MISDIHEGLFALLQFLILYATLCLHYNRWGHLLHISGLHLVQNEHISISKLYKGIKYV